MLRLLSDEDVPGSIVRGLRQRQPMLEIVRVQEVGLTQTPDPDVLAWAAGEGRQILTRDRNTMTRYAYERIRQGQSMPGLFVIPEDMPIGQAILELELLALASEPDEWHDRVVFLPF
ncbi:MAG: DUF5615 family PIN-like protein [Planctomycetes bacterium]|nr:DUF5615 family PIN-like protein [Planctomycetota bacterium]